MNIKNAYFNWMYKMMCHNRFSKSISYKKLFSYLHDTEFRYLIPMDANRAEDGLDLRYRFPYEVSGIDDIGRYLKGPCSVLEMLIALAIRCEETIMDDPLYGDRTGQWFWGMITNLGLGSMNDERFDLDRVEDIVERFLERDYEPDGTGGLFTIKNCDCDLRDVEIWHQLCYYLDTII